jgi:nucleoside-diphosphate-sugar epimerase
MKPALVTGATSQVGQLLMPQLAEVGYPILASSRRAVTGTVDPRVTWVQMDLRDASDLPSQIAAADTLIHLAPVYVLPDFLQRVMLPDLRRVLVFSTTSAVTKTNSANPRERAFVENLLQAEGIVQRYCTERQIAWTIFRPTMIYGLGVDNNVSFIARFIERFGFFPLVGRGEGLRQPVHVADLTEACIAALDNPHTHGHIYPLGGADGLPYRVMVERIFAALGRQPHFIRLPMPLLRMAIRGLSRLQRFAYLTPEMANRMNQDMAFDIFDAVRDFGYQPRRFRPFKSELIKNR